MNLFGTDGIRQEVGKSPLTADELPQLGYAIGQWAIHTFGNNPTMLIGSDTRRSKDLIKSALASGILTTGIHIVDVGILPTPGLYALIQQMRTTCALMISASHNPYTDNGIKIITQHGKLSFDDEQAISDLFHAPRNYTHAHFGSYITATYTDIYIDHVMKHFGHLDLTGKRIVLDCAHGAAYIIAPKIFKQFGAQVYVINDQPNGKNINDQCGAVHPKALQQAVLDYKADIGFAFDGDADRVIVCTQAGYIKTGDHLIALLTQHTRYNQDTRIVGTIMSNMGLELYIKSLGKTLIRTSVGDKYVAAELAKHSLTLGGESSGHIILADVLASGDGIATALAVCEAAQHIDNWEFQLFQDLPQIHSTLLVKNKKDLTMPPLCDIIASHEQQLPQGRIIVRYSGTEPVLRIMIEEQNQKHAQLIGASLVNTLRKALHT